jgi:hypothetical protein
MSILLKSLMALSLCLNMAWAQDATLKADALKLWQKRDDKESLVEAIKKFEQLHKATPADSEILLYLTRSNFLMGDSHSKDKAEKISYFEKAMNYGDMNLALNAEYASRLKKNDEVTHQVKALGINEVPQMYWALASVGRYAKTNGIFSGLKYKSKILALLARAEELKADYFYGAIPRYWASYYAVIPGFAGKDLKKSKKYFEKAMELGPQYYGNKVLMAETYYVEKEDEKEFKKILNEVIADSSQDNHPELGAENRMEKIKAKKLLEDAGDLF